MTTREKQEEKRLQELERKMDELLTLVNALSSRMRTMWKKVMKE